MSHVITGNTVDRFIIREYHGVKPYPKSLIIPDIDYNKIDFHVILGFAHEKHNQNGKGTGDFFPDWQLDICGINSVKEIKEKYPKVKVLISIGGRDAGNSFDPIENEIWIHNAVESLKKIIQQNNADGIDICYDYIKTNEKVFSYCVGEVIKRLKDAEVINVVSIAPFHVTDNHYRLLYQTRPNYINWVDYQFYMQRIRTEHEFLNLFWSLTREYDPNKLLVGASTDPHDRDNVPLDRFVSTCTALVRCESLSGIFIWNANDYEKIALDILGVQINYKLHV
jgi:hypothetical protein